MKENDNKIVIYGASGHAKVIADIVEKSGNTVLAFVDDDKTRWGKPFFGYPVWEGREHLIAASQNDTFSVIIGVGDNNARRNIQQTLEKAGIHFGTAIHPSAQIARDVTIGIGTVIMANVAINSGAVVGSHCIVNTAVSIDHDCVLGDFVHLSPGAHLGGTVRIGALTWIGLGASIINNIDVAENAIVGAGAVVIRNVEPNTVIVGNPAKRLKDFRPF